MACAKVVSRFEVMPAEAAGRRRHRSDEDKVRIVEESLRGHRQGSATARRYGISRSLLTRWRREYRDGLPGGSSAAPFTALQVVPDGPPVAAGPVPEAATPERVEIALTNGRRPSIAPSIDEMALVRLVRVLERA